MVPGESPCYITFHTFLTFHTFHTFLTFHTFHAFHTFHTFHTFLNYLTLGFPVKPVFFWVVVSAHFFWVVVSAVCRLKPVFSGFFLGGVFGTFFWVGFLAQHGPEPPSPILLTLRRTHISFPYFRHGRFNSFSRILRRRRNVPCV